MHKEQELLGGGSVVRGVLLVLVLVLVPAKQEVQTLPEDIKISRNIKPTDYSLPGRLLDSGVSHAGDNDLAALLPVITHVSQHPILQVLQQRPVQLLALLALLEGVGGGPVRGQTGGQDTAGHQREEEEEDSHLLSHHSLHWQYNAQRATAGQLDTEKA